MAHKETLFIASSEGGSYLSCTFGYNYLLIEIDDCCNLHFAENVRRGYQKMFASLQNAWEQVGDKLRDHGKFFLHSHPYTFSLILTSYPPLAHAYNIARLKVEEKYLLPSFTLDTPLEYLIPTTVGAGACTTALTDFLVLTHNNFIEACQDFIKQYQRWGQL